MTTSCEADMKATATASSAKARVALLGDVAASSKSVPPSASCVSTSQPRLRPSQGRSKRSISGAHRNLKV
jgi:hypothetical protein